MRRPLQRLSYLVVTSVLFSNTTQADITTGLVAYYPFNGNANDETGNFNDGIVYGAILTANRFGKANSAYDFNGFSDYIDAGEFTISLPLTVSLWFKSAQVNTEWSTILGWNSIYTLFNGIQIRSVGDGRIGIRMGSYLSDILLNGVFDGDNKWHNITLTRNDNNVVAYMDGSINTTSIITDSLGLTHNLYFGKSFRSSLYREEFLGTIDDIRIYNRALSATDIRQLYQEKPNQPLTIIKQGAGNGAVISNPAAINCGTICSAEFAYGTNVTLAATPASGSIFSGFSGDSDCIDEQVTMDAAKTCIANFNLVLPTVVTNAASNITATSATLSGSVISNGATATTAFDFGTNLSYGQTLAATPAQVYSNTAVAVSADAVGLTCATNYHFRAKAISNTGSALGLDKFFTTSACVINSWLYPANTKVIKNQPFTLSVIAKSDGVKIGNYEFALTIDSNKLRLDATYCNQGICPGTNALANNIVYVNATTGAITITGQGGEIDPGNDLQLLVIHLRSKLIPGNTSVPLVTKRLETLYGDTIGLGASGATVTISPGICGDSDGNTAVNIVDALSVARNVVGLPSPPTVDSVLADVNENDDVDINDALFIARFSVGLLLPPGVCAIGQPL